MKYCKLNHKIKNLGKCSRCYELDAPNRFWKYVVKTKSCWLWTGSKTSNGYGGFHVGGGKYCRAHIFAYKLLIGNVPEGKELHHECNVKLCIRPSKKHVMPLTHLENVRRGKAGKPETVLKILATRGY